MAPVAPEPQLLRRLPGDLFIGCPSNIGCGTTGPVTDGCRRYEDQHDGFPLCGKKSWSLFCIAVGVWLPFGRKTACNKKSPGLIGTHTRASATA